MSPGRLVVATLLQGEGYKCALADEVRTHGFKAFKDIQSFPSDIAAVVHALLRYFPEEEATYNSEEATLSRLLLDFNLENVVSI